MAEVLHGAAVVCTTLTGALMRDLRDLEFDVVVIDEAAQVGNSSLRRCWLSSYIENNVVVACCCEQERYGRSKRERRHTGQLVLD